MQWPRADVLSLTAIILGGLGTLVAVTTPEIRCWFHLQSESCQNPVTLWSEPESRTNIRVGGATSMARMTRYLSEKVSNYSTNMRINYLHQGSNLGMKQLSNDEIDVAALSRELSDDEKQKGFIAVPVGEDSIAVVVGKDNLITLKGLSDNQVEQIFRCEITDWSSVDRNPGSIEAINRGYNSGTRNAFQKQALKGKEFCRDIKTWPKDQTTPILPQLGSNGITYATYSDVANQSTIRVVAINDFMPNAPNYPYRHSLYYVYKSNSRAGKEFLNYINSPQGRKAIEDWKKLRYVYN